MTKRLLFVAVIGTFIASAQYQESPTLLDLLQQCKESRTLWLGLPQWQSHIAHNEERKENTFNEQSKTSFVIERRGDAISIQSLQQSTDPVTSTLTPEEQSLLAKILTKIQSGQGSKGFEYTISYELVEKNGQLSIVKKIVCKAYLDFATFKEAMGIG